MTIFGLNSPEIFIILLIIVIILGPNRLDKIQKYFFNFLKFLLSDKKSFNEINLESNSKNNEQLLNSRLDR